jgi:hypothetical protein
MMNTTFNVPRELCRGERIEAQYGNPDLSGNPLIEALPHLLCKPSVMEKLEQRPDYNRVNDCSLPQHRRIALLDNLGRFFQPLPRPSHVRLCSFRRQRLLKGDGWPKKARAKLGEILT